MQRLALMTIPAAVCVLAFVSIQPVAAKGKPRGYLINRFIESPYYNPARPRQGTALENMLREFRRTNPKTIETFSSQIRTLQTAKPGLFLPGRSFNGVKSTDDLSGTLFDSSRFKRLLPETRKDDWKGCETPDCGASPPSPDPRDADGHGRPDAAAQSQPAICVTENMTCEIEAEQQTTPSLFCFCIGEETIEAGIVRAVLK